MQHKIARELSANGLDPKLEVKSQSGEFLDIACGFKMECWGIEIKYKTAASHHGPWENHSAQNNGAYDVIKDIERLERWKAKGWIDHGCLIFITNDHLYWTPARSGSMVEHFRFIQGSCISGVYTPMWQARSDDILLKGTYTVDWIDGPNPPGFRALAIFV